MGEPTRPTAPTAPWPLPSAVLHPASLGRTRLRNTPEPHLEVLWPGEGSRAPSRDCSATPLYTPWPIKHQHTNGGYQGSERVLRLEALTRRVADNSESDCLG